MLAEYMDTIFYLLGKGVVILALIILAVSIFGAVLILYSFKTGHFFAARLMLISISLLESVIKALFLLARADASMVDDVGIRLRNYINRKKFLRIPHDGRFIFIPQCVRSVDCPAKLTPEGIKCIGCGRCDVGEAKKFAEGLGYRFFVVSGSSFIKRIIKKYRPEAIIGVGCQLEIKEGLDLCHSHDIPAIGILLTRAGCVSTTLDWNKLYDEISDRA
ncbi:MAG: DUF116 domain-containing protein [Methanotrichaceae archaeon]|jgi:hypothetical protein